MRKVVSVDGTFLTGRYGSVHISSCAQDGKYHIFPVAFAIFDWKNDNSWTYFFHDAYRHPSIRNDVADVYKLSRHGFCMYHITVNLRSNYGDCNILYNFQKDAKAYTLDQFSIYFDAIMESNVEDGWYLENDIGFEKWTRDYFTGNMEFFFWNRTIYPVPYPKTLMRPSEEEWVVHHPSVKLPVGRTKEYRVPSVGLNPKRKKQRRSCSICRQTDHYKSKSPRKLTDDM
ncbi:unnamed protein product [Withania somnifera]